VGLNDKSYSFVVQMGLINFTLTPIISHGSSKQRVEWFAKGVKSGLVKDCNTFN